MLKLTSKSLSSVKSKKELVESSVKDLQKEPELRPEFIEKIKRREKENPVKYDF